MQETTQGKAMKSFTINRGGDDNPGGVIVTVDWIEAGHVKRLPGAIAFPTIEAAREDIQKRNPSHTPFPRSPEDAPHVIETWL